MIFQVIPKVCVGELFGSAIYENFLKCSLGKAVVLMKRIALILLALIILFVSVLWGWHAQNDKKAAEEMYKNFCTALSDYPTLPVPFISSFCQLEKDGIKYLTIQNEGEFVTGVRFANGETLYFHNGNAYYASDAKLVKTEYDMVNVNGIIDSYLSSLILDNTVLYTYHRPTGAELPLWIYPDDPPYLRIERGSYSEYMETMIYSDADPWEIRWCITKSSSDEDTKLFLHAAEDRLPASTLYIHGWGNIPEDVMKLFATVE